MADSCQQKYSFLPNCFPAVLVVFKSRVLSETEPVWRRLITLIFAGWLPPDLASSRSCLFLSLHVSSTCRLINEDNRGFSRPRLRLWYYLGMFGLIIHLSFLPGTLSSPFILISQAVGVSTSLAIAHMNPQSSRAIAVIINCLAFPFSNSRL